MSSPQALRLMQFNAAWRQDFEQARSSILMATEGRFVDLAHIGSTVIDGMVARPVIDMMAGLSNLSELNVAAELVEGLNYRRVASPNWADEELVAYLEKPRSGEPTHTVLLARVDGFVWNSAIALRERLQSDLSARQQLENLKRENYSGHCGALAAYTAAKQQFFDSLLD